MDRNPAILIWAAWMEMIRVPQAGIAMKEASFAALLAHLTANATMEMCVMERNCAINQRVAANWGHRLPATTATFATARKLATRCWAVRREILWFAMTTMSATARKPAIPPTDV
jgi:hypothetical protein